MLIAYFYDYSKTKGKDDIQFYRQLMDDFIHLKTKNKKNFDKKRKSPMHNTNHLD